MLSWGVLRPLLEVGLNVEDEDKDLAQSFKFSFFCAHIEKIAIEILPRIELYFLSSQ